MDSCGGRIVAATPLVCCSGASIGRARLCRYSPFGLQRGTSHAEAIRQLQRQVADLTAVVTRLDAGTLDPEQWTSVRDGVNQAVDDLGRRIAALHDRVERLEQPDRAET